MAPPTQPGDRTALLHSRAMITIAESRDVVPFPAPAQTLEESGLSLDLVLQLTLKSLHFAGELTGTELSRRLGLEFPVIAPALELLKGQQLIAIVGGSFVGGASYRYRITDAGRTRAALFLATSHYVGAAPVPLAQYQAYLNAYRAATPRGATRERVRGAFSHLVISDQVLDQLGPAINAGHSMFVYGPPGNGKTVISQAHPHAARRRHRHPARDRGRRPHHPVVRSRQS